MTGTGRIELRIDADRDRGRSDYSAYHALWPLAQMGVVSDLSTFASEAWDRAETCRARGERPTRVALIDTSVAVDHPNLSPAIDRSLAIDFFSRSGGVPLVPGGVIEALPPEGKALPDGLPAGAADHWTALAQRLRASAERGDVYPATSPSFSGHGTAMAGLIGARPLGPDAVDVAAPRIFDPATGTLSEIPGGGAVSFAFAGVDPYCKIVPISTHFDPEPLQLIEAMLYAVMIKADVIVLARDFPSPDSLARTQHATCEELSRALGIGLSAGELSLWQLLEELTLAISHSVPVICAGGNGAQAALLNPACLAAPDNGIIAVGAATAAGQVASYSPDSKAITIYAPSGDGERLDRDLQRLDVQGAGFNPNEHSQSYLDGTGNFGVEAGSVPTRKTHAPQDLISTDVPGRAGYNSSPNAQVFGRDGAVLDYRSAYCRFSGTSGAVALTAGLVSLAMSAGRIPRRAETTGIDVKAALTGGQSSDPVKATPRLHWSALSELSAVDV